MPVDGSNPLIRAGLQQLGCDDLLDREHDAVLTPDTDRGAAILHGFHCVLDLEVSAVGGEDGVGEIVACSYRRLRSVSFPKGQGKRMQTQVWELTILAD